MKLSLSVPITAAAQSLAALAGTDYRQTVYTILQAPSGNAQNILVGDNASQPGFLIPGGTLVLERISLSDTFVRGTGGDAIILLVLN